MYLTASLGRKRGESATTRAATIITTMVMTNALPVLFLFFLPFDFEVLDLVLIKENYSFSALFVEGAFLRHISTMTLETAVQNTAWTSESGPISPLWVKMALVLRTELP